MDSNNLKYTLLLFCVVVGQFGESLAVGKLELLIRCSDRCDRSLIRERSSKREKSTHINSLCFLGCFSGADCDVGEYCNHGKLGRDI